MNYPWNKGIRQQGVKTASSRLPEIQKIKFLMVLPNVLRLNPSISKTILGFQKYGVRRQTGIIARDTTKLV